MKQNVEVICMAIEDINRKNKQNFLYLSFINRNKNYFNPKMCIK